MTLTRPGATCHHSRKTGSTFYNKNVTDFLPFVGSRLIANPRAIRKMLDYPGFRRVLQDPKIVDLQRDPEILADMQSGNLLGVFANRKVIALLNDSHLRQAFSPAELEAALDYAENSANDNENRERE